MQRFDNNDFLVNAFFFCTTQFYHMKLGYICYHVKYTNFFIFFQTFIIDTNFFIFRVDNPGVIQMKTNSTKPYFATPSIIYDIWPLLSFVLVIKNNYKYSKLLEWVAVVATQDKWHLRWKDEFVLDLWNRVTHKAVFWNE